MWAKKVERWDKYRDCWLGTIESPIDFGCEVSIVVKKWLKKEKYQHSYFVSTLKLTSKRHLMSIYNARGGAEVEQFRGDKSGLYLDTRQKSSFIGQKSSFIGQKCIVHLTDIAHNLLADFHDKALKNTRFEGYGNKRIVRRLLSIPGRLVLSGRALKRIELLSTHENAKEMLNCLKKYCSNM